ncbi:hypothetical protein P8452_50355 [Trifolium repens]|nr:hypothetical protein P8452_50355 [Trifolium repens]
MFSNIQGVEEEYRDPSEVRHQTGEFGKAFQNLLSKIKEDHEFSVEFNLDIFSLHNDEIKWRGALRQAAALAGFVVLNKQNILEQKLLRGWL